MATGVHAARGASAALLAVVASSNLLGNRRALLKLQWGRLQLVKPSRNAAAVAIFVGAWRRQ